MNCKNFTTILSNKSISLSNGKSNITFNERILVRPNSLILIGSWNDSAIANFLSLNNTNISGIELITESYLFVNKLKISHYFNDKGSYVMKAISLINNVTANINLSIFSGKL